jgi:hypothetical protein
MRREHGPEDRQEHDNAEQDVPDSRAGRLEARQAPAARPDGSPGEYRLTVRDAHDDLPIADADWPGLSGSPQRG